MSISLSGFPAYIAIIIFVVMLTIIPMYLVSKLRRKTYEFTTKYDSLIKAEYEPPYDLTPAELGYLTDAKFSKREFFATILDLEQRGYLSIEKGSAQSFSIVRHNKDINNLHDHERLVVTEFSNTNSLSLENRMNLSKFRRAVVASLAEKGLVKKSRLHISTLPGRVLMIFLIFNALLTILFVTAEDSSIGDRIFFLFFTPLFVSPITLPVSLFFGYLYHKVVGETGLWTKKMKGAWAEVAGYKHFIEQVELDNIQFEHAELQTKTKIAAFPYAVALGLDTDWEKRFKH